VTAGIALTDDEVITIRKWPSHSDCTFSWQVILTIRRAWWQTLQVIDKRRSTDAASLWSLWRPNSVMQNAVGAHCCLRHMPASSLSNGPRTCYGSAAVAAEATAAAGQTLCTTPMTVTDVLWQLHCIWATAFLQYRVNYWLLSIKHDLQIAMSWRHSLLKTP